MLPPEGEAIVAKFLFLIVAIVMVCTIKMNESSTANAYGGSSYGTSFSLSGLR